MVKRLQREHFASGRQQQLPHVFAPDAEAAAADAGDDFELARALRHTPLAQRGQVLDAGDLVARCAVVFGELGFDDDLRVELTGDASSCARSGRVVIRSQVG